MIRAIVAVLGAIGTVTLLKACGVPAEALSGGLAFVVGVLWGLWIVVHQ